MGPVPLSPFFSGGYGLPSSGNAPSRVDFSTTITMAVSDYEIAKALITKDLHGSRSDYEISTETRGL